jgi:hypothetical protein
MKRLLIMRKKMVLIIIAVVALAAMCFADEGAAAVLPPFHLFYRAVPPSPVSQSLAGAGTAMILDGFGGLINPALTNAGKLPPDLFAAGFGRDNVFDQAILPFAAVIASQDGMVGAYYRYMRGSRGSAHNLVVNFAGTLFEQVSQQGPVEFGMNLRYEGSNLRHDMVIDAEGTVRTSVVHGKSVLMDVGFYQPHIYPRLDFAIVIYNLMGYVWRDVDLRNRNKGWIGESQISWTAGLLYTLPLWSAVELRVPLDMEVVNMFTGAVPNRYVVRTGGEVRISQKYNLRFGYAHAPEDPLQLITDFDYRNLFFGGAGVSVQSVQIDFFAGRDEIGISATYMY